MATWKLTAQCLAEEVYAIDADSMEEAQAIFERGDVTQPVQSEVISVEEIRVEPYES